MVEVLGAAVSVEQGGYLTRAGWHLVYLLLFGLPAAWGLRPPWAVEWLGLPLLPLALILWCGVYLLLVGVPAVLFTGFIFTNFGADPSGRYFLPLAVPFALAGAEMVAGLERLNGWRWGIVVFILVYQLWGNVQVALQPKPGFTTQFDQETIINHRYDGDLIAFYWKKGRRVAIAIIGLCIHWRLNRVNH